MTSKSKLKSIYRRYKKYPSVWCILINLVCIALPPYSIVGTIVSLTIAGSFGIVLWNERQADIAHRVSKLIVHKTDCMVEELYNECSIYREVEAKRKFYSAFRFSAGDQFRYDGKWHKVASVNFKEDLVAYDISIDEDDDLQLVWVRFENIERYKPHFIEEYHDSKS